LNVKLNSKNEEIFNLIPREYRGVVINSILTRSFENASLVKELNFYLNSEEVDKIIELLEIPDIKIEKEKKYYSKDKRKAGIKKEIENKKKNEQVLENAFSGFDY